MKPPLDLKSAAICNGNIVTVDSNEKIDISGYSGLSSDSRLIQAGAIFVATKGAIADGHDHIPEALNQGASLIVYNSCYSQTDRLKGWQALTQAQDCKFVGTSDPRVTYAHLAAKFWPEAPETIAAITGSNGKSSVAWLAAQLWRQAGHRAASLGTLGLHVWGDELLDEDALALKTSHESSLTTLDAADLHQTLSKLSHKNISHIALEASSHGLDQKRLEGVTVHIAAFTNLSRDHLDYHKTMEAYQAAKGQLFSHVMQESGCAVINIDTPAGRDMLKLAKTHCASWLSVGKSEDADIRLIKVQPRSGDLGLDVSLLIEATSVQVHLKFCGLFQAENLLLALGLLQASSDLPRTCTGGICAESLLEFVSALKPVPGRMQPIGRTQQGGLAVVDFAHTPDALERCCEAARAHLKSGGRLGLVFGAGGDRDQGKRPEMGRIAHTFSDFAIVTNDNPRTEDPATIAKDIQLGHSSADIILDRRVAIATGLERLQDGDILIVAGRGHESKQIVGEQSYPFHDPTVVAELVKQGRML